MNKNKEEQNVYVAVEGVLDAYLEINNHRKTPERYTILRAVYSTEGHFTLDELGARLSDEYNFRVSRATLYNTLKLFLQLRLVQRHRLGRQTRYEACYATESHCHQICTVCGRVIEVEAPELAEAVKGLHLRRFRQDGFAIYIYGICSRCQATITRQRNQQKNKS